MAKAMIGDRDIWCAAGLLLTQYGNEAPNQAAQRAGESLNRGDIDGYAVWRRIFGAAAELARSEPADGERIN